MNIMEIDKHRSSPFHQNQRYKQNMMNESRDTGAPITVNMNCPHQKVGELIGKRGIIVQEIMKRSGCKVYVDQNFPEGHPRQIQLTGNPKALSVAMSLVSQVIECGPSVIIPSADNYMKATDPNYRFNQNGDANDHMMIPHSKVGTVIGFKGTNVNEIMRRSGCRVQVLQDNLPDGVDRKVIFCGSQQQIAHAKTLVAAVVSEGPAALTSNGQGGLGNGHDVSSSGSMNSGLETQEVDIQPEKVKIVIGTKGVTILEIMKKSGCRMVINQNFPPGQAHKIVYTGTHSQIEIAKYLVETLEFFGVPGLHNIIGNNEPIVLREITIFQSLILRLLGSQQGQGMTLNDIQTVVGVKITIDTNPVMSTVPGPSGFLETTNKLVVIGRLDNVENAIKLIYQIIDNHTGEDTSSGDLMNSSSYGAYGLNAPLNLNNLNSRSVNSFSPSSNGSMNSINSQPTGRAPALSTNRGNMGPVLALGADGTAGQLESPVLLADGSHQQVAEIKNEYLPKLLGPNQLHVQIIRNKSGASVMVLNSEMAIHAPTSMSVPSTRVLLAGMPSAVTLASQMVQEVLVNGIGVLQTMPDVQQQLPPQQQQQQQQQHQQQQPPPPQTQPPQQEQQQPSSPTSGQQQNFGGLNQSGLSSNGLSSSPLAGSPIGSIGSSHTHMGLNLDIIDQSAPQLGSGGGNNNLLNSSLSTSFF